MRKLILVSLLLSLPAAAQRSGGAPQPQPAPQRQTPIDQQVWNRDAARAHEQQSVTAEEKVRLAEKDWAEAVSHNDFERLEKILAPDLMYTHSTGLVENREQFVEALKSGRQKYDSIIHEDLVVHVYGKTAFAAARVRMTGNTKGQPFNNVLRFLHVWVKGKGGWQLAAHQSARIQQ